MEIIYSYSRQQAIEDGVLIDVTHTAKEAGIAFPTALTSSVWGRYVAVPDGIEFQDEAGRLWDILWMFRTEARKRRGSQILFSLYVQNDNTAPKLVTLKAICGPGDEAEPVITIMLPNED